MKKPTKKQADKAVSPAEPKGTVIVSVHPNLVAFERPGQPDTETTIPADAPANFVDMLCEAERAKGFDVEVRRFDFSGKRLRD